MTQEEFRDRLFEYYQSEILGEVFFEAALRKFVEPRHRYKISNLLQLETETKAWLRLHILKLGGSVEELEISREAGRGLAESLPKGNWEAFVLALNQAGEPLKIRQREVAKIAPAPFRELAESMRVHGENEGIRHVYIKPRSPQLNGKVERSHRSDQEEFYQLLDYKGDKDLEEKLEVWENFYNFHRPHGAFDSRTPYEILRERLQ